MKLPTLRVDVDALLAKHKEGDCKHPRTELRKKPTVNGGLMIREQCLTCGGPCEDRPAKQANSLLLRWRRFRFGMTSSRATHFEQRSYDYVELRANADAEIRAKWLARYKEYRKTPEWKRKRALILKRDKHQCQGCSTAPATQAHHLTYDHVGEEFLFELVTVCNSCHKRLHDPEEEQVPF